MESQHNLLAIGHPEQKNRSHHQSVSTQTKGVKLNEKGTIKQKLKMIIDISLGKDIKHIHVYTSITLLV